MPRACISGRGRTCEIRFRERDLARIPARWLRCDSRASVLTGAPRAATSPMNAMRNYLFACLESEARLALLAHGLDPTLGVLHADQRNRDSLALDAMEPVRADVDAFCSISWKIASFTARDFGELPNGICRIAAPLTHELALTLPHWRECCGRSRLGSRRRSAMRSQARVYRPRPICNYGNAPQRDPGVQSDRRW